MKEYFDQLSNDFSKKITRKYSTSFSLGILFLNKKLHTPICSIYGFVRLADEIVDSFHQFPKEKLLRKFRQDTLEAIEQKISLNPVLNSFQNVVHDHHIEWSLIDQFLKSMEMDLDKTIHNRDTYNEYILGSAEVVGLMCLRVFTDKNKELYEHLKPTAMKLGAAFQKVNFLRDVKADNEDLGRTYFPGIDLRNFSKVEKMAIEEEIEQDFKEALVGIKQLPHSSRHGVYLAYYYYKKLFDKIKRVPAQKIMSERIRIPNSQKIALMLKSQFRLKFNLL